MYDMIGRYLSDRRRRNPLLIQGDCREVLKAIPDQSIDCVVTSPPYWMQRKYDAGGIGREDDKHTYLAGLVSVFSEVRRSLKNSGSLWINLGDKYHKSCRGMLGLPMRFAVSMLDSGWYLMNDVIWNKKKGPDKSQKRLTHHHEHVFHFVKSWSEYFYDEDAVRNGKPNCRNMPKAVASAAARVNRSKLTKAEKKKAIEDLYSLIDDGIPNFVLLFRGQRCAYEKRAKQLQERGYAILRYDPRGAKIGDVWEIDQKRRRDDGEHPASYPEEICEIPVQATCPLSGVVLDPFCGSGTTLVVAKRLGRRSIGIDLSAKYLKYASIRLENRVSGRIIEMSGRS